MAPTNVHLARNQAAARRRDPLERDPFRRDFDILDSDVLIGAVYQIVRVA
jgi:hypothetical protein